MGQHLFGAILGFSLEAADLTCDEAWQRIRERAPAEGYDLVLYLGVHHHLPAPHGQSALEMLLSLARGSFAIRTPRDSFSRDRIDETIQAAGFVPVLDYEPDSTSFAGPVHIYVRPQ